VEELFGKNDHAPLSSKSIRSLIVNEAWEIKKDKEQQLLIQAKVS
jgi:hypothetical protein